MALYEINGGNKVLVEQTDHNGAAAGGVGSPFSVVSYKSLEDQIADVGAASTEWTGLKAAVAADRDAKDTQFDNFMSGLADDVHTHPNGCLVRLRTAGGQATDFYRFNWIDYARLRADTDQFGAITDVHEAFCDGTETASGEHAYEYVYVAAYSLSFKNGEVVSQSGNMPITRKSLDESISLCNSTEIVGFEGKHRLWSIWDRSLVLHHCMSDNSKPLGNTAFGYSHSAPSIAGISEQGSGKTLTGTMGRLSSHTCSDVGIYDLVGNLWEWCYGLETYDGRLKIIPDNRSEDCSRSQLLGKAHWLSHVASNGRFEIVTAESDQIQNGPAGSSVIPGAGGFNALSKTNSVQLRRSFIAPIDGSNPEGAVFARSYGDGALLVGGDWSSGGGSGLAMLNLSSAATINSINVGFRSAFAV